MTTGLLQGLAGRMPVDLFNKWTQKAGGGGSVQQLGVPRLQRCSRSDILAVVTLGCVSTHLLLEGWPENM